MGLSSYLFGKSSEDRACEYLKTLGFRILERNFRSRFGEIDIIALDENDILCFVEVKASGIGYDATFRLTRQKYSKILKTINFYLLKNGADYDFEISLLVINNDNFDLIRNLSL
ncbi:YraN family protein [Campylobacter mucosalis]|uniref:UPF0102 protein CMUC_0109 n=1 Tax=Campylobacter mucosalis CCUG 21559 TaxID=1032067 RepID=A0A6G5QEB3_9BACT|nr:YraN family protein [Campylobacter mucosalis]QCD43929.1 putative UPF0102 domain protein [Campylobacter mucosalis CCUG 21559]